MELRRFSSQYMILYVVKIGVVQADWVRSMPGLIFLLKASLTVSEEGNELFRLHMCVGVCT